MSKSTDDFEKEVALHHPGRCFVVYQTGPWEGAGSWLYRARCVPHDWTDYAASLEDAREVGHEHRQDWNGIEIEEF